MFMLFIDIQMKCVMNLCMHRFLFFNSGTPVALGIMIIEESFPLLICRSLSSLGIACFFVTTYVTAFLSLERYVDVCIKYSDKIRSPLSSTMLVRLMAICIQMTPLIHSYINH